MRNVNPRQKYIDETFGVQDPELQRVREELARRELSFMAIGPAEGRILQFLIRAFGVRRIVEVGTLFGYSALCMARALPEDGQLITLEKSPENFAVAKSMFAGATVGDKIESLCGDAVELLAGLRSKGPVDMVFIDANKSGYLKYLDWAENHVRPGGLIVGDNTFLFGALWGPCDDREAGPEQIRVMTEFNRRLADPAKYNSVIVPTGEGMTVAQRL